MKKNGPVIWLVGCSFLNMVIIPTINHYLELLARKTFSPLPLFWGNVVLNLLLGVSIVILAAIMWDSPPTPILFTFEGLIFGYTLFTLFSGSNNIGPNFFLPNYTMRTLFLGFIFTITFRSLYSYLRSKKKDGILDK